MNMHAMNMQLMVVVGADWTLHQWRHNSSNVGGVTAGQVAYNSSQYNDFKNMRDICFNQK